MAETLIERDALRARQLTRDDIDTLVEWFSDPMIYRRWWGHEEPYEAHEIAEWFLLSTYEPDQKVIVEDAGLPIGYWSWRMLLARPRTGNLFGFVHAAAVTPTRWRRCLSLLTEFLMTRQRCYRVMTHPEGDSQNGTFRDCLRAGYGSYSRVVAPNLRRGPRVYYPASRLHPPLITTPGPLRDAMNWPAALVPDRVPANLAPLIPLAKRWGILDNDELREAMSLTPLADLSELVSRVEANGALDDWLDDMEALTDEPSNEYVALAAMTEAARIARMTIDHRLEIA